MDKGSRDPLAIAMECILFGILNLFFHKQELMACQYNLFLTFRHCFPHAVDASDNTIGWVGQVLT